MKLIKIPFGHLLLCLFALLPMTTVVGQGFELIFEKLLPIAPGIGQPGYDVIETSDNNLLVLTNENGADGQVLKKLDPNGNLLWEQELGVSSSLLGVVLLEMANGNIVVVGDIAVPSQPDQRAFYWQVRTAGGTFLSDETYHDGVSHFTCTGAVLANNGEMMVAGFKNFSSPNPEMTIFGTFPFGGPLWTNSWPSNYKPTTGNLAAMVNNPFVVAYHDPATDNVAIRAFLPGGSVVAEQVFPQITGPISDLEAGVGSGLFLGIQQTGTGDCIFKLDNDLAVTWSALPQGVYGQLSRAILAALPDGGCGATGYTGGQFLQLFKMDAFGNQEWDVIWDGNFPIGSGGDAGGITTTANGGFAFCGGLFNDFNFVIATDTNGQVNTHNVTGRIVIDYNGNCQLDAEDFPFSMNVTLSGATGIYNFQTMNNGLFNFTAETGIYDLLIDTGQGFQLCQTINVDASQPFGATNLGDVLVAPDVYYTIAGTAFQNTNPAGGCIFNPGEQPLPGSSILLNIPPNGHFQAVTDATGQYSFNVPGGLFFTISTDSVDLCSSCNTLVTTATQNLVYDIGLSCLGALEGFVFNDENMNCAFDTGEQPLVGWQVAAVLQNTTDTTFINTNSVGNYLAVVDPGIYEVFVIEPNNLWASCAGLVLVNVGVGPNPIQQDFPMQAQAVCPLLRVDVGTNLLRPCMQSHYTVRYCNDGTDAALAAYVEVALDPLLFLTDSQLPATDLGNNSYRFDLGDLPLGFCGEFWFKVNLACWATPGATHCVEAHIFPDSTCAPPDPTWDGSNIELLAVCENDSIRFTLTNSGLSGMAAPLPYLVIEDNVLLRPGEIMLFQLPAGGDTTVVFPATGGTFRLETQQSPGHPSGTLTAAWVEGCGAGSDPLEISYVTQYPFGDEEDFIAIDCRQNVFSYDPNDKLAFPQGVGNQRFIQNTTELDYQIRFQNTGTASALEVVLRDTLSPFLDPAMLQPGASSHPYNFTLENGKVAVFTFPVINLPPQSASEEASQGWVKFRIAQTPGNQPGTVIENRAAIYFDQNPPIVTPLVFHQIPFPETTVNEQVTLCEGEAWQGQFFENDTTLTEAVHYAFFDSVFVMQVEVLPAANSEIIETLCFGGSLTIGGTVYNEANPVGEEIFAGANGCDSTVYVSLSFDDEVTFQLSPTLCPGESLTVNGTVYNETNPTGNETFINGSYFGCDSTVQVSLGFHPEISSEITGPICEDSSIMVGEFMFYWGNSVGEVVLSNAAANGCDSTVYVDLDIIFNHFAAFDTTLMPGDVWQGTAYWEDTFFTQVFPAMNGCDSVVDVSIYVLETATGEAGPSGFGLQIFPNPSTGASVTMEAILPEAAPLTLHLHDATGRRVCTFFEDEKLAAGRSSHLLDLAGLPPGVYHLLCLHPEGRRVVKLVRL